MMTTVETKEEPYRVPSTHALSYDKGVLIPLTMETIAYIPDQELKVPFEYHPLLKCFPRERVTLTRHQYETKIKSVCERLNVLLRHVLIKDQVLIKLGDEIENLGANPITAYYSILTRANVYSINSSVFQKYANNMFQKAVKTTRYILDVIVKNELSLYVNAVPWFLHFPFYIGEAFPRVVTLLLACDDEGWVNRFCEYVNIKNTSQTVRSIRSDPFLFTLLLNHLPISRITRWSLYKRFYCLLWDEKERKQVTDQKSMCFLFFILLSKHCVDAIGYLKMYVSVKRRKLITKMYNKTVFLPTHEEVDELYSICCSEEMSSSSSPEEASSTSSSSDPEVSSFVEIVSSWFGSLKQTFASSSSGS